MLIIRGKYIYIYIYASFKCYWKCINGNVSHEYLFFYMLNVGLLLTVCTIYDWCTKKDKTWCFYVPFWVSILVMVNQLIPVGFIATHPNKSLLVVAWRTKSRAGKKHLLMKSSTQGAFLCSFTKKATNNNQALSWTST